MASRALSKWHIPCFSSIFPSRRDEKRTPTKECPLPGIAMMIPVLQHYSSKITSSFRQLHDGRPRGPLWRGNELIAKEALFVILGLKRFQNDTGKTQKFIKTHVLRLLKLDMIAVLTEVELQELKCALVRVSIFFLYHVNNFSLWESTGKEKLFSDSQTYMKIIRGFLKYASPADALNIYEDMKNSLDLPEELPFRILLKGLLPYPLLRTKVKQDFEELFPDQNIYDRPEEIFGVHYGMNFEPSLSVPSLDYAVLACYK